MSGETCQRQPNAEPAGGRSAAAPVTAGGFSVQPQEALLLESDCAFIRSFLEAPCLAVHGDDNERAEARQLATAIRQFGLRSAVRGTPGSGAAGDNGRRVKALQKWRLKRVIDHIERHISSRITLLDLAAVAGLSRMHFASQFRAATGLRPHQFLLRERVRSAEALMQDPTMTLLEIAMAVGFQTQAHFTTVFKRFSGCTPRHWRMIHQAPAHIRAEPEVADHH
ncbi:helix-turn-helix domain-containing protein [Bradyrhizobium genosp. P]|uniref:helix-turn-helix domain-containing protein n=1 Tax=Bradyrhizobium genosp. P TaxID=83641 RepID=UPI003CF02A60